MRSARARLGLYLWLGVAAHAGAVSAPLAVSPGSSVSTLIGNECPTFSWGLVPGAVSYELIVYRLDETNDRLDTVLRRSIDGTVGSWTPGLDLCFQHGDRYAWSVRARAGEWTDWSSPRFFEITSVPSDKEFREALRVVRQYLASSDEVGLEQPDDHATETAAPNRVGEAARGDRGAMSPALTVDGGIAATEFSGDGSALTNLDPAKISTGTAPIDISGTAAGASDLVCTGCVATGELGFDPAEQSELDSHAGDATAHHAPTMDTTCDGAVCDGSFFTNVTADSGTTRVQIDDLLETTETRSLDRYVMRLNFSEYSGSSKKVPDSVMADYCGDVDGCQFTVQMRLWSSGSDTAAASSGPHTLSYSQPDGRWRTSEDLSGQDGNGTAQQLLNLFDTCFFSDGEYSSYSLLGDVPGFNLLLWNGSPGASRLCELILDD